jgi:peptide/nickel transport system substrate-binding protein
MIRQQEIVFGAETRSTRIIPVSTLLCLCSIVWLCVVGCGLARAESHPVYISSSFHRITVCLPSYPPSLDPTDHRSRLAQLVIKNIYESLTNRNADLEIVPELAESWRVIDPLTWEFQLKKGVFFHNGEPFTSRDVKYTFDRVILKNGLNGRMSPRRELFEPVRRVEVVDPHTVRITTVQPWPILPLMLSLQEIMPAGQMPAMMKDDNNMAPIGTGPFRYVSSDGKRRIELTRNTRYHDDSDQPATDGEYLVRDLVFEVVPQLIDQVRMLKSGQADLIFNVPTTMVDVLEQTPGITVISQRATRSYFGEFNCARSPFDDPAVRQALNYAVDKEAIVRAALLGRGRILPTLLIPEAFAYNETLTPYPYSPARAKALLAQACFPADRKIRVRCNNQDRELGGIITFFLTKLGLSATLDVTDDFRPNETSANTEWDIHIGSWGNSTLDPVDIIIPKFKSRGKANFSSYSNPEVDRLIYEAEHAASMEKRASIYREIQAVIYHDAPMIFGYAADEFFALSQRVHHFHPPPSGFFQFKSVTLTPVM